MLLLVRPKVGGELQRGRVHGDVQRDHVRRGAGDAAGVDAAGVDAAGVDAAGVDAALQVHAQRHPVRHHHLRRALAHRRARRLDHLEDRQVRLKCCLGAFVGVFFVSVEIAVCISFVKILYNVTRPHTARLGNIPGTNVYRNVTQYPNATLPSGILAIRVDTAIYFSNSNYILDKILRYLEEETQRLNKSGGAPIQYLIVDLTPVTNIDTSGIIAFEELEKTLKRKNIQLAFANPGSLVVTKLDDSKFLAHLGSEWLFFTVSEAIQVCTMLLNQSAAERQV